jgi:hypothetical protein
MTWISPRIWRNPDMYFSGDEPLQAPGVYTRESLAQIAGHGFDAIWVRGRLRELVDSRVFPQLNTPRHAERLENLAALAERGRAQGVSLYIYFNEPLAIKNDDPFWLGHEDLRGTSYQHIEHAGPMSALCTSHPRTVSYFKDSVQQVMEGIPGLGGVILITTSEYHTHCWSHHLLRSLDDGFNKVNTEPLACERCRDREPADVVAELISIWTSAAAGVEPSPRVLAWNWSWNMWYEDPQREVIDRLPKGVEIMADWERGGTRRVNGRETKIDEYSLGYAGPSERFISTCKEARRHGMPVHAKLQIGTTHEITTVPNLPLIGNLHAKLCGLVDLGIDGAMLCWNCGCALTLNSQAVGLFGRDAEGYLDRDRFFYDLVHDYFGEIDAGPVVEAWLGFASAFDHYPFSIRFVYKSPINYAPAYPLTTRFCDRPMGPSWLCHEWGDRLEDCLDKISLDELIDETGCMSRLFAEANVGYQEALTPAGGEAGRHRFEERSCASMIGCHLRSVLNIMKFHRWKRNQMQAMGLSAPCDVPLDDAGAEILSDEHRNALDALHLVREDPRLGYHQEAQAYMYDADRIRRKLDMIEQMLEPLSGQAGP